MGARVTDEVEYLQRRGNRRAAVRVVTGREPDNFRWRSAVRSLSHEAGHLRGMDRLRIEEPIREVVLDIDRQKLKQEIVIDARRYSVDLDRGEILPVRRVLDLRRYAYIMEVDERLLSHYLKIPEDYRAPIDTAGVVLVSRALSKHYRRRSDKLLLDLPQDGSQSYRQHHHYMAQRAERDADLSRRWAALAREVLGEAPVKPKAVPPPLPRAAIRAAG